MKMRDVIIALVAGFALWVAYLIFFHKFDPNAAVQKAWQDIVNMWNQIIKYIQNIIKPQTPSNITVGANTKTKNDPLISDVVGKNVLKATVDAVGNNNGVTVL